MLQRADWVSLSRWGHDEQLLGLIESGAFHHLVVQGHHELEAYSHLAEKADLEQLDRGFRMYRHPPFKL